MRRRRLIPFALLATILTLTATLQGGPTVTCNTRVNAGEAAGTIDNTIANAASGTTICLETGTYPELKMLMGSGQTRTAYTTIRPAPGATVTMGFVEVRDSSYERWEHLKFAGGIEFYDGPTYTGSHDYEVLYDTFENTGIGVTLRGPTEAGAMLHKITLEHDYFHNIVLEEGEKTEGSGSCKAGTNGNALYLNGSNVSGVTVKHNTFSEVQWHYIEGGPATSEGMTVENNLFTGHVRYYCSHLNVWQIFGTSVENIRFNNNLILGEGTNPGSGKTYAKPGEAYSEYASLDMLEWENGEGALGCAIKFKNATVENNLAIDAGNNSQIFTIEGLTVKNNTIVNMPGGFQAGSAEHCGNGTKYEVTHNIGASAKLTMGAATEGETFDYNATSDESAKEHGSTHYVAKWTSAWKSTAWNRELETKPSLLYYAPAGLSIEAGYKGSVGP